MWFKKKEKPTQHGLLNTTRYIIKIDVKLLSDQTNSLLLIHEAKWWTIIDNFLYLKLLNSVKMINLDTILWMDIKEKEKQPWENMTI